MAKIDKTKEEIGYFKVLLSISVAIDVSMNVWLYQKIKTIQLSEFAFVLFLIIVISTGVFHINKHILAKIDQLEEL